ncbi:hypothetical protein [Sphingomonas sp.]|uniref:hypothetical protein n=1 Tax=Sphingomonas sp. TaxID=28214 RepID=UPI00389E40FA
MNRTFAATAIVLGFVAAVSPHIAYAQQVSEARAIATSSQSPEAAASCALPSEPNAIAAALDAAITGPADKDRTCMTWRVTSIIVQAESDVAPLPEKYIP